MTMITPIDSSFAQQRHDRARCVRRAARELGIASGTSGSASDVGNVDRPTLEQRAAERDPRPGVDRIALRDARARCGDMP